jgi:uncharacterized repeat protein (TIGR01451 family)
MDVTTDPQTDLFTIAFPPGSNIIDYRGVWRVNDISNRASVRTSAFFTVSNPAQPAADLLVYNGNDSNGTITAGSNIQYVLWLSNKGPDAATVVQVTDLTPANTTFLSGQSSDPAWTCEFPDPNSAGGNTTCTLASLAPGATNRITLIYNVNGGTPAGTTIENTAHISSNTPDPHDDSNTPPPQEPTADRSNNNATSRTTVVAGAATDTCTLSCPANIVATADTSQAGQPGAFVTFSAAQPLGTCGAVSNNPVSGSFFTVGEHIVSSSSESGASCTFTVTVVDTAAPTISCPPDKTATANQGGTATVAPGVPTTIPATDVIVTGVRSDGSPAIYDEDGNLVSPAVVVPLTDPYPIGTTGITWTVTDSFGRTASCQQRIIVHAACASDNAPPTITAPANISVGTGEGSTTCGAVLDDELGLPDAHDDCSVTVTTSGIPAGNLFPIGTTTITYTATDGAGHTASATQHVTVTDDTPPAIAAPPDATYTCPSEVPAANPSQAHGTNPNLPNGGPVFDNCGTPIVTVSDAASGAGSAASPLIIMRTFKATDTSPQHNSASAVQKITVVDSAPPTFTSVPANVTAYTGPGAATCGTVVSDATLGTATAQDNCSVTIGRSGVPSGNSFPVGNTIVTYTATDGAGNTATATQTVTVIDNTPPTISCAAGIVADFDPAVNGAVVTYTTPVGADNCAGAVTTQTAGLPSGGTFPLGTTTNTFRVTDAAGNTAQCSFQVTVALTSIIGLDSVSITGSALVDSYDSTGGYPATKGSLANVLSNGTITIGGSGKVFGNVRSTRAGVVMTGTTQVTGNATAGTNVSKAASATIGGTITNNALAPVMTLPAVPSCGPPYSSNSGISGTYSYNATTGDLTLSGVNIATLANGTYCFHNVSLSNSAQLKVNGPVVIRLTGTLTTGGATSLPNTTMIPSNLQILSSYSGSNGVTLGNSSSLQLVIYAPNTGVSINGAAPLFGTVAAKTITLSNSGMIHYDTQLKSIWPAIWTLIFGP